MKTSAKRGRIFRILGKMNHALRQISISRTVYRPKHHRNRLSKKWHSAFKKWRSKL